MCIDCQPLHHRDIILYCMPEGGGDVGLSLLRSVAGVLVGLHSVV